MGNKLDQVGVYRGSAIETAFQFSRKGSFPMFVMTLRADEKFVEDPSDLEFFVNEGVIDDATPQWVDWSDYNQTIRTYMVLFTPETPEDDLTDENATNNYKQLQTALDWNGTSFDELTNGTFENAKVLFRTKEEENPQYGPVTVCWVDSFDAPPQRQLKSITTAEVSVLNKRLKLTTKKAAPKAAAAPKPAAVSPKEANPTVAVKRTTKSTSKASASTSSPTSTTPSSTPPAPAPTATAADVIEGDECTKEEAWAEICTAASETVDPDTISDTWIKAVASAEANAGISEDDFTGYSWAKVRETVLQTLNV